MTPKPAETRGVNLVGVAVKMRERSARTAMRLVRVWCAEWQSLDVTGDRWMIFVVEDEK
jgi:hypothetical protein